MLRLVAEPACEVKWIAQLFALVHPMCCQTLATVETVFAENAEELPGSVVVKVLCLLVHGNISTTSVHIS